MKAADFNLASPRPDGIPTHEITFGSALSLAESVLDFLDRITIVPETRTTIEAISSAMPWGALAASNTKLCMRLVSDDQNDVDAEIWGETKRLLELNIGSISTITAVDVGVLIRATEDYVNNSLLRFLVGEDVGFYESPRSLGVDNYTYSVLMAHVSSAVILGQSKRTESRPESIINDLRQEIRWG